MLVLFPAPPRGDKGKRHLGVGGRQGVARGEGQRQGLGLT